MVFFSWVQEIKGTVAEDQNGFLQPNAHLPSQTHISRTDCSSGQTRTQ